MGSEGLVGTLGRICEALPDEAAVTLPVGTLRTWLAAESHLLPAQASEDGPDLTVADVAAQLRRSPSAVRAWLTTGQLSGYRLQGKAWRIPRAALDAFRQAQQPRSVGQEDRPHREPAGTDLKAWRRVRRKTA